MDNQSLAQRTRVVIAVYIACGFLTYGYGYNRYECLEGAGQYICNGDKVIGSFFAAVLWPVYWAGKVAIKVTK